ncbi:MAG: hypothetical protein HY648_06100 [Acidobacteria bacterium]|nr:hypothetical protein [Acidobacteriota bacterium]
MAQFSREAFPELLLQKRGEKAALGISQTGPDKMTKLVVGDAAQLDPATKKLPPENDVALWNETGGVRVPSGMAPSRSAVLVDEKL